MNEVAPACACGCGKLVSISKRSTKSQLVWNTFAQNGCQTRGKKFPQEQHEEKIIASRGYIYLWKPDHPKANCGRFPEHVLVAEKALGRYLPNKVEVHHIDEDKKNNKNNNLVICQDRAYHLLIHQRTRALKNCGHADWRKCSICKIYGDPKTMRKCRNAYSHWDCYRAYMRRYYHNNKEKYGVNA